jgi:DNA-directed RNA polymerase subunit M/transcription elongation factor TFIIS
MKFHATAPSFSVWPNVASFCPECHDLMVAATTSQHVGEDVVRHWWSCESCGHEYPTTVTLPALNADARVTA